MSLFALAKEAAVIPAPGTTVLKAGDYAVMLEAEELLRAARERARQMETDARNDAERIREQARAEGLEEGKGEVAGQLFEAVTASVDQLSKAEGSMVDIVMRSIRTILGEFDDKELVSRVVGHALRLVRDEGRVLLRVAPEDADAVRDHLSEMLVRYPGMGRVDVRADESVKRGGCVMETEAGVIDATLERQLSIIESAFARHIEER